MDYVKLANRVARSVVEWVEHVPAKRYCPKKDEFYMGTRSDSTMLLHGAKFLGRGMYRIVFLVDGIAAKVHLPDTTDYEPRSNKCEMALWSKTQDKTYLAEAYALSHDKTVILMEYVPYKLPKHRVYETYRGRIDEWAHAHGLQDIHRGNVRVRQNGQAVITDYAQ